MYVFPDYCNPTNNSCSFSESSNSKGAWKPRIQGFKLRLARIRTTQYKNAQKIGKSSPISLPNDLHWDVAVAISFCDPLEPVLTKTDQIAAGALTPSKLVMRCSCCSRSHAYRCYRSAEQRKQQFLFEASSVRVESSTRFFIQLALFNLPIMPVMHRFLLIPRRASSSTTYNVGCYILISVMSMFIFSPSDGTVSAHSSLDLDGPYPCPPGSADCIVDGYIGSRIIYEDEKVRIWNFTLPVGHTTSMHRCVIINFSYFA